MNTHDIELPPLPDLPAYSPAVFDREVKVVSETMVEQLMHDYARSAIEADRQRRGEPVAWRWRWKDIPGSGWQLSSVGGWRETDAIRAEPLYLAPVAPQPALDAADLAFIADELRQAGKNRAADLVLTAMAYPTQPAEPVKAVDKSPVPSNEDIAAIWNAVHGFYGGAPFRMNHADFARALLARYGNAAQPAARAGRNSASVDSAQPHPIGHLSAKKE